MAKAKPGKMSETRLIHKSWAAVRGSPSPTARVVKVSMISLKLVAGKKCTDFRMLR